MKGKSKKRIIWILVGICLIVCVVFFVALKSKDNKVTRRVVKVEKATIVDKALAVGSIEPINEIAVKSQIPGVVGKLYVNVGDFASAGDPLLEVKPDPTPQELVQTKRNVEMAAIELAKLRKELERNTQLKEKGLISDQDFEVLEKQYDESFLKHKIAKEQLELLEKGKVRIADTNIETVIKSPISGYILDKLVNVGDPVVPLTSYQAGTELLRMANMSNLLFKGTVDEIDVGKISESLKADLQIGALPGKTVTGHVSLISLKARKEDNTTVFPIEIVIDETNEAVLRAGFSANANIIIAKRDSVLSIPERVITFRNDSAFVYIPQGEEGKKEIFIETGLSDAINIEVVSGLEKGQEVLEKESKEII